MKNTLVLMMCVILAGVVPAVADEKDDQQNSNEAKTPHHELREAVAKIRSRYSPNYFALANYRLAGVGNHVRIGIILGAGGWSPGDDAHTGAVIMAVTPGSPADEAGLLAGDVVTTFNGEPLVDDSTQRKVASMDAARRMVELSRELEDGDKVTLEYVRDGSSHRVDLVAREFESCYLTTDQLREMVHSDVDYVAPYVHQSTGSWFFPKAWLGMELVALNPGLGEYFGADSGVLVVRGPEEDDPLGVKSGDVILSIGDREVSNPEHAMRILRSYEPEEELSVQIIRHGRSQTLTGTVPNSPIDFDFRFDFRDRRKPVDR